MGGIFLQWISVLCRVALATWISSGRGFTRSTSVCESTSNRPCSHLGSARLCTHTYDVLSVYFHIKSYLPAW